MKVCGQMLILLFTILVLNSCGKEDIQNTFDNSGFTVDKSENQLCFDLSNDLKLQGALSVKATNEKMNRKTIILPFEVQKTFFNSNSLNTYCSLNNYTIIDFSTSKDKQWISFVPKFDNDANKRQNGILWLKDGLKREFQFNIDNQNQNAELSKIADSIAQVAILLPSKSKAFRNQIEPNAVINNLNIYEIDAIHKKNEKTIKIEYMVTATEKQKELIDFLLKLAAIIFIPITQLIFLDKNLTENSKIKTRKWIMIITVSIQFILFCSLGYLSYEEYKDFTDFPKYEIILLVAGFIFEVLVLWIKKEKKA